MRETYNYRSTPFMVRLLRPVDRIADAVDQDVPNPVREHSVQVLSDDGAVRPPRKVDRSCLALDDRGEVLDVPYDRRCSHLHSREYNKRQFYFQLYLSLGRRAD